MQGRGGVKGENWENCNSIINRIYLKNKGRKGNKKNTKQMRISVRSLWDNFKHNNISIMGVPDEEERKQKIEK